MTKITPEILTALMQYKMSLPHAVNAAVAENIGVKEASISRIFSGIAKEVRPATWAKMKPLIAPYLSPEALQMAEDGIQYQTAKPMIPPDLLPDLEKVSADIDVPVSSMVPALLKALIRAHNTNTVESLWPPRLAGDPKEEKEVGLRDGLETVEGFLKKQKKSTNHEA